jgi:hypothetical protein
MRKTLIAAMALASGALIAVIPATALAQHGSRHHHGRIHHRRFDHHAPTTTTTTTTTTTPPPTASVVSFTNGVLTITANGTIVSGMVTHRTDIDCVAPPTGMMPTGGEQGGDGGWRGRDRGRGDHRFNQMCTSADLVAGATVLKADLSVSGAGATWTHVLLLVTAPSTTPTTPTTTTTTSTTPWGT